MQSNVKEVRIEEKTNIIEKRREESVPIVNDHSSKAKTC